MIVLPFRTDNPTERFPIVTSLLIVINVMVYLYELQLAQAGELSRSFRDWAIVPLDVGGGFSLEIMLDFVRSMFLHGGWAHLLGNMLYLYIFGKNIEDTLGEIVYLFFYLFCGVIAGLSHVVIAPNSPIPLVGASGAIAGMLGAYLLLFPGARVRVFVWVIVFFRVLKPRAGFVLIAWFLLQVFEGYSSLGGAERAGGGIAYAAHVGGFLAGLFVVWLMVRTRHLWGELDDPSAQGDYQ
jgi:membrane associated rhomboid family serine protease